MKRLKSILLAIVMLCSFMITACGPTNNSYTVTLMDGKEVIRTIEKDKETHLDVPAPVIKDGYTFIGWYVDAELTTPYEPEIFSADLTLYAKFEKEDLFISFKLNGGAFESELTELIVKNGENYQIPTPVKPGYTFTGWTVDGEDFESSGIYNRNGDIRLTANWTINKYSVEFKDGETVLHTETVEYGKKVDKWNSPAPGYEIAGYYADAEKQTAFDFDKVIENDTDVFVKLNAKTYNITVNMAMGINTTAVYGKPYEIETPERTGYTFKGFEYNGESFPASGTYNFADHIIITALWEKDVDYWKSTVSLYDGNTIVDFFDMADGAVLKVEDLEDAPEKQGYVFDGWYSDAMFTKKFIETTITIESDLNIYAKYIANEYKITVDLDGGLYDGQETLVIDVVYDESYSIPTPNKYGYKCVGFICGDDEFLAQGKYQISDNVEIKAVWEKLIVDQDETGTKLFVKPEKQSGYYKEREDVEEEFTYVFLRGEKYDLTTLGSVVKINEEILTEVTFDALEEDLTLEITKNVEGFELTYTRNARVVENIYIYGTTGEYNNLWGAQANRTNDFMDAKADAVMSVGKDNYIPDIVIAKDDIGTALSMQDAYVSVVAKVDGQVTEDYDFDAKNGQIDFGEALVGKVVELTFTAKYSLEDAILMNVKVNAGVNVYDNEQLRVAYADHAVSEINVLRNIVAEVAEEDYVSGTNRPKNDYEYGIYTRQTTPDTDNVVVNGNFFTIDGSKLPLGHNGVDGHEWSVEGTPYYVNNMQIGLFLYACRDNGYRHTGKATFNDLYLLGNVGDNTGKEDIYNGKKLLVYSGAYHGIVCRGGSVTVNNSTIMKTNIAIFTDGGISAADSSVQASQWKLNQVKLDKSWGNQVYLWDLCSAQITNSYLGTCGGAAIHVDDRAKASTVSLSTVVNVDSATRIENYVIGTEAWFNSRGMEQIATGIKGKINTGLLDSTALMNYNLAQTGKQLPNTTVIKQDVDAHKMNFALLVRAGSTDDEAEHWLADPQGKPYVETNLSVYFDAISAAMFEATGDESYAAKIFDIQKQPAQSQSYAKFAQEVAGIGYVEGYVEVMLAK